MNLLVSKIDSRSSSVRRSVGFFPIFEANIDCFRAVLAAPELLFLPPLEAGVVEDGGGGGGDGGGGGAAAAASVPAVAVAFISAASVPPLPVEEVRAVSGGGDGEGSASGDGGAAVDDLEEVVVDDDELVANEAGKAGWYLCRVVERYSDQSGSSILIFSPPPIPTS